MMGTLAAVLAGKKISTSGDRFRAEVKGDIEDADGVLKITRMHVQYHLKVGEEKKEDAKAAMGSYIVLCPGAQSVINCIDISDELIFA